MYYIQYAGYVEGKYIGRRDTIEDVGAMIDAYILVKGLNQYTKYSIEKRIGEVFDFSDYNRLKDRYNHLKTEIKTFKPNSKEFDFSEVEKLLAKDNIVNTIADSLNMPRDYFKGVVDTNYIRDCFGW